VVPSAGGLYPLRVYFVLTRQQGELPAGYYQFDPKKRQAIRLPAQLEPLAAKFAFNRVSLVHGAPMIVVIAASLTPQVEKYGNRGYLYPMFEAGAVEQNLVLGATELGLGALVYGGLNADAVAETFGMQGVDPLIAVAVGYQASAKTTDTEAVLGRLIGQVAGPDGPIELFGTRTWPAWPGLYAAFSRVKPGADGARYAIPCSGTSASSAGAELAAVAEAYERLVSGRVPEPILVSMASELPGPWVDPHVIAPLSEEQWKREAGLQPFDPNQPWQWVEGQNLATGEPTYVPVDLISYPFDQERFGRLPCASVNSSGVAAHSDHYEAVRRAFLEGIERDAFMRRWLLRQSPSRLPLTILPPSFQKRVRELERQGWTLDLLDMSEHGVAVVGAVIHGPEYPCFIMGMGASDRDYQSAAIKAFWEALLMYVLSLEQPPEEPLEAADVWSTDDHMRLYYHGPYAQKLAWLYSGELVEPAAALRPVERAFDALQPVMVDLTGSNDPLQVVRVMSPQLVPLNFGLGCDHYTHHTLGGRVPVSRLDLPHCFG
jgi:thiazole/oxazole-forming peptide maturase SagD family component